MHLTLYVKHYYTLDAKVMLDIYRNTGLFTLSVTVHFVFCIQMEAICTHYGRMN
jgi:hypothetical protein